MSILRVDTLKTRDGTYQVDVADLVGSTDVDQLRIDLTQSISDLSDETVHKSSDTGVAILPEGTTAQRPNTAGLTGLLVRGNTDTKRPEWFDRENNRWTVFGDSSGEVFNYAWHNGTRASIAEGRVPTDGQQLTFLLYPDICQAIWDGKQHSVTEATWQSDPTKRNVWSIGDGTSWVRVPDLNAVLSGKPFYLRGGPDSVNGSSVGDGIRNITGKVADFSLGQPNNVFAGTSTGVRDFTAGAVAVYSNVTFDASRVVPVADENRVKTAYGVWTVRVFSDITNEGAIDAGQLATQLAITDAKVQTLDAATGFTIIYPNGGSAVSPANVSINTRYVMANPFPGYRVLCLAELFIGGVWGATGFIYPPAGGVGVSAFPHGEPGADNIITTTGSSALCTTGTNSGSPHVLGANLTTPTPCRVKVWKLKGSV